VGFKPCTQLAQCQQFTPRNFTCYATHWTSGVVECRNACCSNGSMPDWRMVIVMSYQQCSHQMVTWEWTVVSLLLIWSSICVDTIRLQPVRFQVLTAASMMFRAVFWGVLPCKMIIRAGWSSSCVEAVRTAETSVDNHFTRQYNPEDSSEHQSATCSVLTPRNTGIVQILWVLLLV
jgi:hypothetical protein